MQINLQCVHLFAAFFLIHFKFSFPQHETNSRMGMLTTNRSADRAGYKLFCNLDTHLMGNFVTVLLPT